MFKEIVCKIKKLFLKKTNLIVVNKNNHKVAKVYDSGLGFKYVFIRDIFNKNSSDIIYIHYLDNNFLIKRGMN